MRLYDPIFFLLAVAILLGLVSFLPFQLDDHLGLTGFFVGFFTFIFVLIEGGPGLLTKLIALVGLAIIAAVAFNEWYSTSTWLI